MTEHSTAPREGRPSSTSRGGHVPCAAPVAARELAYLEQRAEAELAAAQAAQHPAAVRAHFLLASEYLERLYRNEDEG